MVTLVDWHKYFLLKGYHRIIITMAARDNVQQQQLDTLPTWAAFHLLQQQL
jgi:hypothetical protein